MGRPANSTTAPLAWRGADREGLPPVVAPLTDVKKDFKKIRYLVAVALKNYNMLLTIPFHFVIEPGKFPGITAILKMTGAYGICSGGG